MKHAQMIQTNAEMILKIQEQVLWLIKQNLKDFPMPEDFGLDSSGVKEQPKPTEEEEEQWERMMKWINQP